MDEQHAPLPSIPNAIDVARLAGVSQSAVSRAFTEGASVSPKTRQKVMAAAAQIGYMPNLLARSLISGKSNIVGVALGNLENEFYSQAFDALSHRLSQAGRRLLVFTAEPNAQVDAQIEEVLHYRVDALILLSTSMSSALAQRCQQAGVPIIQFNRTVASAQNICSVTGDNVGGAEAIGRYLLECDYRTIAFMAGFEDSSTSQQRELSFTQFLLANGRSPPIRETGNFSRTGAIAATRRLLQRPDRPDAIFCANDYMAIAAIEVARHEFGLKVGQDIGIVGFDDIPMASWPSYELTTYSQPIAAMAEQTVNFVLADADVARPNQHAVIAGELLIRSSTRAIR